MSERQVQKKEGGVDKEREQKKNKYNAQGFAISNFFHSWLSQ